ARALPLAQPVVQRHHAAAARLLSARIGGSLCGCYPHGMATTTTPNPPCSLAAPPITRAQPPRGFFPSLELPPGPPPPALPRRFRPGYVARMTQLRQGHCPDCPHDVIDPRDLKYCRNVCGYRFRPEDDRFAWRGRLGLARYGLAELLCFSLLFAALTALFAG